MRKLAAVGLAVLLGCTAPPIRPTVQVGPPLATRVALLPARIAATAEVPPTISLEPNRIDIEGKSVSYLPGRGVVHRLQGLEVALVERRRVLLSSHPNRRLARCARLVLHPRVSRVGFLSAVMTVAHAGYPCVSVRYEDQRAVLFAQQPGPPCLEETSCRVAGRGYVVHVAAEQNPAVLLPTETGPVAPHDERLRGGLLELERHHPLATLAVHIPSHATSAEDFAPALLEAASFAAHLPSGGATLSHHGWNTVESTAPRISILAWRSGAPSAVRPYPTSLGGGPPLALIRREVRAKHRELRACFRLSPVFDRELPRKMKVQLTIGRDGRPSGIRVLSPFNAPVNPCLVSVFRKLVFPASGEASGPIIYPLVYGGD